MSSKIFGAMAITLMLCGCEKDPVNRCIDARVEAFDEKYPDGVSTKSGKTRADVERDASLTCLYMAGGAQR